MNKKIIVILLLFCFPLAALSELAFIPLYHQQASDILPKVKGFLKDGESIIAGNNEIIIRVESSDIKELEEIVKRLDKPLQQLLILVKRAGSLSAKELAIDTQAKLQVGTLNKLEANVQLYGSTRKNTREAIQEIRVLDGASAFISDGKIEALPVVQIHRYGSHSQINTATQFHDATTGFYLTPHVNRDSVTLEISGWSNQTFAKNNGLAPTNRTSTIIRAQLNQWVALSAIADDDKKQHSGVLEQRYHTHKSQQTIWVKVINLDK